MNDRFDAYYLEFTSSLKQLATVSSSKEEVDALVRQGHDHLQLASIEARTVQDASLKRELLEAVNDGKMQLQAVQQVHERGELLAVPTESAASSSRLARNEDQLARQNETLERARRTMQETEEIGQEITRQLAENREKLASTHGKVNELQSMSDRAGELLQSMTRPWWRR